MSSAAPRGPKRAGAVQDRPPYVSVALLAGVALAFEVLLIRLFSIIQWHHFAYLVISLALLGVGAGGTVAALARSVLVTRARQVLPWLLLAFAVAVRLSFELAQRVPFNVEVLFWDVAQLPALALVYVLLAVPFFLSGLAICLALAAWPARVPGLYGADLLGAGAGAMVAVALLLVLPAERALVALSAAGFVAALVSLAELRSPAAWLPVTLALAGIALQPMLPPTLVASPYKPLSQMLQASGTRIVDTRSGPLGFITVVEGTEAPFRHAPGLSLAAPAGPPAQLALFVDGDGPSPIVTDADNRAALAYLDYVTSAAPYHLAPVNNVAVLGAGAGTGVLQALYHRVPRVHAVELNPQVAAAVAMQTAGGEGTAYAGEMVTTHIADGRGFIAGTGKRFDLIQLDQVDSFTGSAGGLKALSESYLYTIEAVERYLSRLRPGGHLAITRPVQLPPREMPKLVATVAAALRVRGVDDPGAHMLVLRGWQTATLLVGNAPVTSDDIAALQHFCAARAFDLVWHPGLEEGGANRHNRLREPYFYSAVAALLGENAGAFVRSYKFDLAPATDDRPFFGHFMKWSSLAELWSLRGRGGVALVEWGYVVLVVSLVQALVLSFVLIVAPLLMGRRVGSGPGFGRWRVLAYFAAVGLAFLFIEIAVLQKLILLLHHPLHASVSALSGFLVFAGLGSLSAGPLVKRYGHRRVLAGAVAGIALAALALTGAFHWLAVAAAAEPLGQRVGIALALIAPLAFSMGLPFATAMDLLGRFSSPLMPWAWAVNGCASVISAVLAALLAVHIGFDRVIALAVALYVVAAVCLPATGRTAAA